MVEAFLRCNAGANTPSCKKAKAAREEEEKEAKDKGGDAKKEGDGKKGEGKKGEKRGTFATWEGNQNMEGRGENEFMFLKMNGCGHCKAMLGEWNKLKQNPVAGCKFGEYEASKDDEIMNKYNVNSFPTLLLLPKGNGDPIPYDGDRTADSMRTFITKNMVA